MTADRVASERLRSDGPARTAEIAAGLAAALIPGDVVLITGGLGAGKTTFVRGAARALGVREPVTSPTFTIGQRYDGRIPVTHLDLYRLSAGAQLGAEDSGLLEDYLGPDVITFVEWPEIGTGLFGEPAATVRMSHGGGDRREILIERAA
jgi:tRNA threonylcarbamoyladenosine biosynthesis protein TsaE